MKQKLIFLDIDGTLLPPGEMTVPASAVEATGRPGPNGHKVFLCTGRNLRMTKPLLAYGFDGFVCSAGGYVGCDGKILVDLPMEPAQVEGLREVLGRAGAECTLEARDDTYGWHQDDRAVRPFVPPQAGAAEQRGRALVQNDGVWHDHPAH